VEEIALRYSDRILCATPAQVEQIGKRYGTGKVIWHPNFVDTASFRPVENPTGDYLLFVGRLSAQKNLDSFFHGLRLVLDRGVRLPHSAKVVGQGEDEGALRQLVSRLRLPVQFCGVVPNDQLSAWYANAWAYVLPSHFEGMPKTLLEAMSCGAPCIGSDIEGIRNLITTARNGLLVSPTPEGIASGLQQLAEDEMLRVRLGTEARRYVEQNYALSTILQREIRMLLESPPQRLLYRKGLGGSWSRGTRLHGGTTRAASAHRRELDTPRHSPAFSLWARQTFHVVGSGLHLAQDGIRPASASS
jgi:glycosyltransferase involved in cell wall biosynthesis